MNINNSKGVIAFQTEQFSVKSRLCIQRNLNEIKREHFFKHVFFHISRIRTWIGMLIKEEGR